MKIRIVTLTMGKSRECTVEERILINRLHDQKKSISEIAKLMKRSRCCVYNALKHFQNYGYADKVPRKRRARKTTAVEDRLIHRISAADPLLTSKQIQHMVQEHHNINLSKRSIRRRLNEFGLRGCVSRKVPYLSAKNRQKRLQFARKHLHKSTQWWRRILWSDETKINVFGSDGKMYVRRPPRREYDPKYTRKTVKHGGGHIMIWACMSGLGVGPLVQIRGIMNQHVYKDILLNTTLPYTFDNMPVTWKFMQDNDPKHTAASVKQCLKDNFVDVLDWPPQSPDLNPLENLWRTLKQDVASKCSTNTQQLWTIVQQSWNKISRDDCCKLIDSMPRRCAAVIQNKGYAIPY